MLTYSVGLSGVSGVRIREDAHSVRAIPFFGGEEKTRKLLLLCQWLLGRQHKAPDPACAEGDMVHHMGCHPCPPPLLTPRRTLRRQGWPSHHR